MPRRPVWEAAASWVLGAVLVVTALHLAVVAWRLPVDYWDGYEYLNNALAIAGHDIARLGSDYIPYRPPLLPILLAPVMWGFRPGGEGTGGRGAQVPRLIRDVSASRIVLLSRGAKIALRVLAMISIALLIGAPPPFPAEAIL